MTFVFKDINPAKVAAKPPTKNVEKGANFTIQYQLANFNTSRFTRYYPPKFDPSTVEYVDVNAPAVDKAKGYQSINKL
jgi:hypothetical protein